MKRFVCAVLVALSAHAHADTKPFDGNWVKMLHSQESGETAFNDDYYDANSFERNGNTVSYWEKSILANSKNDFVVISVTHNIANCETQQEAQIAYINAAGYGHVELPSPDRMKENPPVYKSFPPNSPGAKGIHIICNVGR